MFAEPRRRVTQARLVALEPHRRGNTLVPVLGDDVAARLCVRALQRLVDRLDRSGRQTCGKQPVTQRIAIEILESLLNLDPHRVAIVDAAAVGREARIDREFRLADLLAQLLEGAVIADADEDQAVAGLE